ncbi:copper amine oxidase N-terminal domain-containing protein [Paenibacillus athensensis]|uniref:Copper amine oxidase-like N-terminal domain-containing protein n=1 Tax=Paenibacillus athensensis TaxID=1967502 RepID=A0A4Y8Q6D0_9BACL|nr:copper amine oxidase N-terminal domain-containing protein [Paenibacillus athensensis]MCD1259735.1 copper amine oxidase N-terminal domain-containing protein [Paenibacillus athensensis]
MKKVIATVTAAVALLASGSLAYNGVQAATENEGQIMVPVIVNGHKVKFPDTEPYVDSNGRTMVPVRFVSEKLGGKVDWNAATRTVTIATQGKSISLTIGSKAPTVNGHSVELDTAAAMVDGRTMVPLRFVSEALESKVTWDEGAHAVQITDAAYQAKIDNGTVKLDAWGRELSGEADERWNKLADVPEFVYELAAPADLNNKSFIAKYGSSWADKAHVDKWADHVREYYKAQLNVDYRNIDTESFTEAIVTNMGLDGFATSEARQEMPNYIAWLKQNHVILRGYADPENSLVRYARSGPIFRTHFKFMIVEADDTTQTVMDNWNASVFSDSFEMKKGVWYDGYADVSLTTNFGNNQEEHYALRYTENMFLKERYKYEENK